MRFTLLRLVLLALCCGLFAAGAQAQDGCDFDWARRAGSPAADAALDVVTDAQGNAYVTGRFAQVASFGSFSFTARGETDAYVAKFRPDGTVEWALQLGGSGFDEGRALAIDAGGNVLVTGAFTGRATFGTFTLFSAGGRDVFMTRIDSRGRAVWAKRAGGPADDRGNGITLDKQGGILLTGSFQDSCGFTGSQIVLRGFGGRDAFSARYNGSGDVRWASRSGSASGDDEGWAVGIDTSGNAYIAGSFSGVADFNGTPLTSAGGTDVFIVRRKVADGQIDWLRQAGGAGDDAAYDLVFDRRDSIALVGKFTGAAAFGSVNLNAVGGSDVFAARYDQLGNVGWARGFGGTGDDIGAAVATDTSGYFYVGGSYAAPITFDAYTLPNAGATDAYISKIDPNGFTFWAINAGGAAQDSCAGVAVSQNGTAYAVGLYTNQVNFGADNQLNTLTAEPDAFIARLCNFTPRKCDFGIEIQVRNAGIVGDDGEILVVNATGGRVPYIYSLDDVVYQFDNLFFDLAPDTFTVYVRDLTGCTDTVSVIVGDECKKKINPRFVGLDTVYCITDPNGYALNVDADETFDLLGYEGTTGLSGSQFFPALAPAGPNEILAFIMRPESGCEDTARITINVLEFAPARITGLSEFLCINTVDTVQLAGSPPGGTFVGTGIVGNKFVPALAGNGAHQITYIGDSSNCQFREIVTTTLVGPDDARIGGLEKIYCLDNESVYVLNPTPPGGTLAGRCVGGNLFDPMACGLGLHRISYYGSFEGCPYFVSEIVEVVSTVRPTFASIPAKVCATAIDPVVLKAVPSGGEFSGSPGVISAGSDYLFVPNIAGVGKHTIFYTGDTGACTYSGSFQIEVTATPAARIYGLSDRYCSSDPNDYTLRGFPAGGFFTAPAGMTGNVFRPFELNASFPIEYNADSAGCAYSVTRNVDIRPVLPEIKDLETIYCASDPAFPLVGRPAGGQFFINGVPSSFFNPGTGPGVYLVEYSGDSATCPYATTKNVIVFAPPATFLTDFDPEYCVTNATPIPVIAMPPGGTLRGPGISGNLFTPAEVGRLGTIVIEYFGTDGGCEYHLTDTVKIIGTVDAKIGNLRNDYCVSDLSSHTLTGTPAGGVFFGTGMIGDQFFPSNVGVGHSQITYIGDSAGCQYVVTRSAFVNMAVPPRFIGLKNQYCSTDPRPVQLQAEPAGGTFSGPGVTGNTLFLPDAGITAGTLRIDYTGTHRGCNYSASVNLSITGECCPTPRLDTLFLEEPDDIRAKWYAVPQGRAYEFSLRRVGDTDWMTQEVISSQAMLPPLIPCTEYEYRVRTLCLDGFSSEWSDTVPFKSQPVECLPPGFVDVIRTTSSTALVTWTPYDGCVQTYVVEYRKEADETLPWQQVAIRDTSILLTGLDKETAYLVRVRTRCAANVLTLPSMEVLFETLPFDPPFCKGTDSLWVAELTPDRVRVRWTPVGGAMHYLVQHKRASDLTWISSIVHVSEFTITNLERDQTFEVRVRTYCLSGGFSDFVGILRFNSLPACDAPTGLDVRNATVTQATVFWNPTPHAMSYTVQWRLLGSGTAYAEQTTSTPSLQLTGLQQSSIYEVRVATNCGFGDSEFTEPFLFATLRACNPPTIVRVEAFATAARVEWLPVPRATMYEVCWRPAAIGGVCDTRVVENPEQLFMTNNDLRANTDYVVRVRALCEEGFTPWVTRSFRTSALRAGAQASLESSLQVYPNPNRGQFSLRLDGWAGRTVPLKLVDLTGRVVWQATVHPQGESAEFEIAPESLAAGVYLLRVGAAEGEETVKVVVQ